MEHAEGTIVIDAPLDDVVDVIEDYESYPEWAEVRRVDIRERGEGGRATEVAFEVDVPVLGKACTRCATATRRVAPRSRGTRSRRTVPSARSAGNTSWTSSNPT